MSPDAGSANFGGPKEKAGTKGYSTDDLPLRDGHNEEPDMPTTQELNEQTDLTDMQSSEDDGTS